MGSRHDRGWKEENDSEGKKGRIQNVEGKLCELYGIRRGGGVRSGNSFLNLQPPSSCVFDPMPIHFDLNVTMK